MDRLSLGSVLLLTLDPHRGDRLGPGKGPLREHQTMVHWDQRDPRLLRLQCILPHGQEFATEHEAEEVAYPLEAGRPVVFVLPKVVLELCEAPLQPRPKMHILQDLMVRSAECVLTEECRFHHLM